MKIVGISGSNASGKDTVGEVLAERHNFIYVSTSEILRKEAKKRGLETNRKVLQNISAEWRRDFGLGVLVDKAITLFKASEKDGLAVGSLRNFGEPDKIHELGGITVWTDADPKIRYARIKLHDRHREAEDDKTYEEFLAEEEFEMRAPSDDRLGLIKVKERADIFIDNPGDDIEAFKDEVQKILRKYLS